MWDPPGPGIELVSPALAGGFLTTGPPGKSLLLPFKESWELDSVLRFYIDSLCWPSDNPIRVQFSCSVVSGSLQPHGLQHAMPPCPSPTSRVCSTHVHWVGDAFQPSHLCRPILFLLSVFPSIRVFSNESVLCIRWPKDWSFSLSISPSNEYSGLISFRMDWLDLLAVQGTLNSLLQHHSSKASILWRSAFFTVQLSYPYMITGKTIALTRQTFVGQVMSLLFNNLSRLVIAFLLGSKHLLISSLLSPSALILEPPKIKGFII